MASKSIFLPFLTCFDPFLTLKAGQRSNLNALTDQAHPTTYLLTIHRPICSFRTVTRELTPKNLIFDLRDLEKGRKGSRKNWKQTFSESTLHKLSEKV